MTRRRAAAGVTALVLAALIVTLAGPGNARETRAAGRGGGVGLTTTQPTLTAVTPSPALPRLSLSRQVGQLLVATYQGATPPDSLLRAIRSGWIGAVILMGDNTAGGMRSTARATSRIQAAARAGGDPGVLVMTDQEGGEVSRLPGAPLYPAAGMSDPKLAYAQGRATGRLLKRAGVNVDLAPVADVIRTHGFLDLEHRSFGGDPAVVSAAACGFAAGLASVGVAYTLKHFPGLGDAVTSTDLGPVTVTESAGQLHADGAAYRRCGRGPLALVMVSSAMYTSLSASMPAVLVPRVYSQLMPQDRIRALTISDSFEAGAIQAVAAAHPARTAIDAGLDMIMYPSRESDALRTYAVLLRDARAGLLGVGRVRTAAYRVLQVKARLGLISGAPRLP